MNLNVLTIFCAATMGVLAQTARAAEPFYRGADVSMLPELEKAGAVYTDGGAPDDAIKILRRHGVNLFRLRLFVNPTDDFTKSYGATQDLATVRALAKRVKSSGAAFLLDLHYSDTWADPGHQAKPKEWADLHGAALEQKVHELHRRRAGIAEGRRHAARPRAGRQRDHARHGLARRPTRRQNAGGAGRALAGVRGAGEGRCEGRPQGVHRRAPDSSDDPHRRRRPSRAGEVVV